MAMINFEHAEYLGSEDDGPTAIAKAAVDAAASRRWVGVAEKTDGTYAIYAWGMAYHPDAKDVIRLGLIAWQVPTSNNDAIEHHDDDPSVPVDELNVGDFLLDEETYVVSTEVGEDSVTVHCSNRTPLHFERSATVTVELSRSIR